MENLKMIDTSVINIHHRARGSKSSVVIDEPVWELRRAAERMGYWIPAFSVQEKSVDICRSAREYRRARAARTPDRRRKMAMMLGHIYDLYVYFITHPRACTAFVDQYSGLITTREFDDDLAQFLVCCYVARSEEGTRRWANALKEAVWQHTEIGMFAFQLGYRAPIMGIRNPMPTTIKAMADAFAHRPWSDQKKKRWRWRW
jgi:hypothetical protein